MSRFVITARHHAPGASWHGATATAIALQRLGRTDLADRLVAWVLSDEHAVLEIFTPRLADQLDGLEP